MNEVELKKEVSPVIGEAGSIIVSNGEQYEYAGQFLKTIKSAQKKVTEYWNPLKTEAHRTWKSICAKENEMLEPLSKSESELKRKMLYFQQEEDRKRMEEQRKLQAIADEKARKERERLEREAEKLKTPELKAQRMAEAEMVEAPIISVEAETPRVSGISIRKTWKAKVVDKAEFVKKALEDENAMAYIEIDISGLNKLAQSTKGKIKYPGIEFYEESSMAAGGR